VLTTRADNKEFADEDEAAEVLVEQIQDVFGGMEAFLENDDVQAALTEEVSSLLAAADGDRRRKRDRPAALRGVSQRVKTGYGKLYVTINEDPDTGEPFEVFANIGHSGGFTNSFTESLGKVISTALQAGVDPEEIVDELCGTRSPKVAWDRGEQIQSIPDAIGTAMRRYLDDDIDKPYPEQKTLEEAADDGDAADATQPDGGATTADAAVDASTPSPPAAGEPAAEETSDAVDDLIAAGESPECPECGSLSLAYSEGCKTCESCGWSEC
jgi:ribonucleoside-diphosphate reductase alpha chain